MKMSWPASAADSAFQFRMKRSRKRHFTNPRITARSPNIFVRDARNSADTCRPAASRSNRFDRDAAGRHVSAEFLASLTNILGLLAVIRGFVKWRFRDLFIRNWNAESAAEAGQLIFIQFFLLVGDVAA